MANIDVEIWDRTGSQKYDYSPTIEDIWFESVIPGGCSMAGWMDKRDASRSYEDLQKYNHVVIKRGPRPLWQGWLDKPKIVGKDLFEGRCIGWSSRLGELGRFSNIAAISAYTFFTTIMLADPYILLAEGDVVNDGYTAAAIEARPFMKYAEIADEYMRVNYKYAWSVTPGMRFNWKQYGVGPAKYIVLLSRCDTKDLAPGGVESANWIHYSWMVDGQNVKMSDVYDADLITDWGRVIMSYLAIPGKCSDAGALARAQTRLNELKVLRMQGGFTTKVVLDAKSYEPVPPEEVAAGDNIRIVDIYPRDVTINEAQEVNELTTMMARSVRFKNKDDSIDVTLSEFQSRIDVSIARAEAKAR